MTVNDTPEPDSVQLVHEPPLPMHAETVIERDELGGWWVVQTLTLTDGTTDRQRYGQQRGGLVYPFPNSRRATDAARDLSRRTRTLMVGVEQVHEGGNRAQRRAKARRGR